MNAFLKLLSVPTLVTSLFVLAACNKMGAHPSSFTIGGSVVNLAGIGGGLVLQDNLKDRLPVNANGTFAFAGTLASGASYSVTILSQPSNPAQICGVTNGSGATTANVTNVEINCGHNE